LLLLALAREPFRGIQSKVQCSRVREIEKKRAVCLKISLESGVEVGSSLAEDFLFALSWRLDVDAVDVAASLDPFTRVSSSHDNRGFAILYGILRIWFLFLS